MTECLQDIDGRYQTNQLGLTCPQLSQRVPSPQARYFSGIGNLGSQRPSDPDSLSRLLGNLSMGPLAAGCGSADSCSIIYQYTCTLCGEIYVGQTQHPTIRQNAHYRTTGKNCFSRVS